MEEESKGYEPYIKSFNTAYTIYQKMPDVAKKIAEALPGESLWNDGFKDGIEQAAIDAEKDLPKYLRKDRLDSFRDNKTQIKGKDKDVPGE